MMKKLLSAILISTALIFGCVGCGNNDIETKDTTSQTADEQVEADDVAAKEEIDVPQEIITGTHHAVITVKDYGTIKLELNGDVAPYSVTSFIFLSNKGFYDNLTFHRIISEFMIQGGDPEGNGTGGAAYTIPGEFRNNGFENNLSHTRGALSMARSSDPNSASSQFFIVHKDSTFLDGDYAVFGYVTEGMDVVDAICDSVQVQDDNGTVLPENQPVIESIVITD